MIKLFKTELEYTLCLLTEEEIQVLENAKPLINNIVLDYPHVSQMGHGASQNRNDCGIACIASILRGRGASVESVDEIADKWQKPNTPMYTSEITMALKQGYNIRCMWQKNVVPYVLQNHLMSENEPIIALVDYGSLPHKGVSYSGNHFILIYGFREESSEFLYHDPLSDGRELSIESTQLGLALMNIDATYKNQVILIYK